MDGDNCHDSSTVSSHFLWARSCGIDFFMCSYWGQGTNEDWTIRNCMFPNPDIGGLKLALFYEVDAITLSNVYEQTSYVCDNYFSRSSYYKIDNKPVIGIYVTRAMSTANLTTYISNIRSAASAKGYQVYIIGDEVWGSSSNSNTTRCSLMDAVTNYDVYGNLKNCGAGSYVSTSNLNTWKTYSDQWKTLAANSGIDYYPGVGPGFNNTEVASGSNPMSRKKISDSYSEGSMFSALLDKAVLSNSRGTMIVTSWNEWHEDTQIEPSGSGSSTRTIDTALPLNPGCSPTCNGLYYTGYGTTYLDILRSKTSDVPIPPADPSNTGVTDIGPARATWTWQDNSTTETGFAVYVDAGTDMPATLRETVSANTTSWTQVGLSPNTQYSFQVIATNGASPSLRTPLFTACTLPAAPAVGLTVACDRNTGQYYPMGSPFTFSNPLGFGPGSLSAFQYAWDTSATHTWSGSEATWNSGTLVQSPSSGADFYLHLRSVNQVGAYYPTTLDFGPFRVDTTIPTSSAAPVGGVYKPLTVELTMSEPGVIYYTTNGSEPTTASTVYSGPIQLIADTMLRYFAVDTVGNAESVEHTQVYRIVSPNRPIASVKGLPGGTIVKLADKVLYWTSGSLGYIEEPDGISGIRLLCTSYPATGMVNLVGSVQVMSANESRILVTDITRTGPGSVRSMGVRNAWAKQLMLNGLYVRVWGMVKAGSVTPSSFVLTDGSDAAGLTVSTLSWSGSATAGRFVSVTGAISYNGAPVVYATEIVTVLNDALR